MLGGTTLASGFGEVVVVDTELTFNEKPLSTRVTPWNLDFDIRAGQLAADLNAKWGPADSANSFAARSSLKLTEVAGFYTDTAFAGLSTDLEINYNDIGISVDPARIGIDLIDMGVPVENITADISLDVNVIWRLMSKIWR